MTNENFHNIFKADVLERLFPKTRTDQFFDALLGDSKEGAYDIKLVFKGNRSDRLNFEFHLIQRPGKCLICNLTHGLPKVFSRHPIINIKGLVQEIEALLNNQAKCNGWELGITRNISNKLHIIPFIIFLTT